MQIDIQVLQVRIDDRGQFFGIAAGDKVIRCQTGHKAGPCQLLTDQILHERALHEPIGDRVLKDGQIGFGKQPDQGQADRYNRQAKHKLRAHEERCSCSEQAATCQCSAASNGQRREDIAQLRDQVA